MKKNKASELQYKVFRKVFSQRTRIHKRREFLTEVLEDLQTICGYSPQQVNDINYRIAKDISFNPFIGVKIPNFRKYSFGFQGSNKQVIDSIEIFLLPASLGLFELFKRDEQYKVNYYCDGELVLATTQYARRF